MLKTVQRLAPARPFGCGARQYQRRHAQQRNAAAHAEPLLEIAVSAAREVTKESDLIASFLPGPLASVVKQLGADLVELIKLKPTFGVWLRLSVRIQ